MKKEASGGVQPPAELLEASAAAEAAAAAAEDEDIGGVTAVLPWKRKREARMSSSATSPLRFKHNGRRVASSPLLRQDEYVWSQK